MNQPSVNHQYSLKNIYIFRPVMNFLAVISLQLSLELHFNLETRKKA